MRKIIFLAACSLLLACPAQAQLGNLMKAAAKKAAQKAVDKAVDKAAEASTSAVEQSLGLDQQQSTQTVQQPPQPTADPNAPLTYTTLLAQMPALPNASQLVSYKEAELNEATLRLLTNPVTTFNAKVLSLSMQALSLAYANVDSATVTEGAYKLAEASTGLSRQELEKMSTMSDEEQEAYLAAHYTQGTAEANLLRSAAKAGELLKPTEPLVEQWNAIGEKADAIYANLEAAAKNIYAKYADRLANTDGKQRNSLLLQYYGETVEMQRNAVQQVQKLRLNEQLPIAEKIDGMIQDIQKANPDVPISLLNYSQLTATAFFTDVTHLLEINEYK